jgi:formyl-CoA transferase
VIDVALYEAVFNCMESLLPEYSAFGAVRGPAGSALPGIAPTNAYPCSDGGYALVAGNGDSIYKRLMATIGRDDLGNDPELANNTGRVAGSRNSTPPSRLDPDRTVDEVLAALDAASVPAGRIYTVADIAPTRTTRARHAAAGPLEDGDTLTVPGIIPSSRARRAASTATRRASARTARPSCASWDSRKNRSPASRPRRHQGRQ